MLAPEVLTTLRDKYTQAHGDPPLPEKDVTDEQLTAVARVLELGLNPYFDFGVWGAHGDRMARKMKFMHTITGPDGKSRTVELPGASCLDMWLTCWDVVMVASEMTSLAKPSSMERYRERFAQRCRDYPEDWGLAASADIRCRLEWMPQEKRRQEAFYASCPQLAGHNPQMPWDLVFRAAADSNDFWQREFINPCLKKLAMTRQVAPPPSPRWDTGKGAASSSAASSGWPQPQQQTARPLKRRANERYTTNSAGQQICFDFNMGKCADPCPGGRQHQCEICLSWRHGAHGHVETGPKGKSKASGKKGKKGKSG